MNLGTLKKLARLLLQVRNPLPVLLDRQGRRAAPYIVRLFSGLRIEIRPGRGDLGAFREAWLQHDYLPPGWRIAPGDTVVNVGANVGCFTLFAAQCVGPAGRVIAIEPEAETFRQLNRNLALNRFENIVARQAAVAGREGLVELRSCTNSLYSSVFARVERPLHGRAGSRGIRRYHRAGAGRGPRGPLQFSEARLRRRGARNHPWHVGPDRGPHQADRHGVARRRGHGRKCVDPGAARIWLCRRAPRRPAVCTAGVQRRLMIAPRISATSWLCAEAVSEGVLGRLASLGGWAHRPEGPTYRSPGQRPGERVATTGAALKGRHNRSHSRRCMSPLQGLYDPPAPFPQGVALGCDMPALRA